MRLEAARLQGFGSVVERPHSRRMCLLVLRLRVSCRLACRIVLHCNRGFGRGRVVAEVCRDWLLRLYSVVAPKGMEGR
jgi:hypothetical protein